MRLAIYYSLLVYIVYTCLSFLFSLYHLLILTSLVKCTLLNFRNLVSGRSFCRLICDLANIWNIFLQQASYSKPATANHPCTELHCSPVCYLWVLFSHISVPALINGLQRLWLFNVNVNVRIKGGYLKNPSPKNWLENNKVIFFWCWQLTSDHQWGNVE